LSDQGWRQIAAEPAIRVWADAALPAALKALAETDQPLRCGGTWAVGLDLLPNDADGGISGVALPWDRLGLPPEPLHKAQISAIYEGYPRPSAEETEAAFRFRVKRSSAHLDGLLPVGPEKRRMIKEPHGYILGLPLTDGPASPLVLWEGSHLIVQAALRQALAPYPPETWAEVDVTAAYQAARAEVFARCKLVEVPGRPGEAVVLHRHLIHGVAPWMPGVSSGPEGRIVAYFRPLLPSVKAWLLQP
jgi:hypothetical protein